MTTWNYRVVKLPTGGGSGDAPYYEVREVFYGANGVATAMTASAVTFGGDTPEEVAQALEMALRSLQVQEVFVPPEAWVPPD